MGELLFFACPKISNQQKRPLCVGLKLLCALQSEPDTVNSIVWPRLPVLDNTKGDEKQKEGEREKESQNLASATVMILIFVGPNSFGQYLCE